MSHNEALLWSVRSQTTLTSTGKVSRLSYSVAETKVTPVLN
jgi:hypothetical protein